MKSPLVWRLIGAASRWSRRMRTEKVMEPQDADGEGAGVAGVPRLDRAAESHLPDGPRVRRGRVRYEALHLQRVDALLAA